MIEPPGDQAAAQPGHHPIRVSVDDDLERSRLTVFFRLLLAVPHYVWFGAWSLAAILAAVANWIATLILAEPPVFLYRFLSAYVRYTVHVSAYIFLAANPFPGFVGARGTYPIDVEIDYPGRQNRWVTGFRFFLAFPALLLSTVLIGSVPGGRGNGYQSGGGLAVTVALLAWFACLARRRMPQGFRDAVVYALRYTAQMDGYLFMLTDRYPDSDPALPTPTAHAPPRGARLHVTDDLRRSRLTVFFRVLLAVPHYVWLLLWGILALVAAVAAWFATLVTARPPAALHRFLSAYLRYATHVSAFFYLVANPFPGFVGAPGSYPVDVEIDPPGRQNRWTVGFRLLLAVPAILVASALQGALFLVGVFGWWYSLVTARMARGLRNLGAYSLRYTVETYAYASLLTRRYPYSGPSLAEPPPAPESAPQPWPAAFPES